MTPSALLSPEQTQAPHPRTWPDARVSSPELLIPTVPRVAESLEKSARRMVAPTPPQAPPNRLRLGVIVLAVLVLAGLAYPVVHYLPVIHRDALEIALLNGAGLAALAMASFRETKAGARQK